MEIVEGVSIVWLIIFIIAGFIAGYIDSIAGGGGMIQSLVLLSGGVSAISTLATNKFASFTGTLISVYKYSSAKSINWFLVIPCLLPCLFISLVSSRLVMFLSNDLIVFLIIACIPVALLAMFTKNKKDENLKESRDRKKAVLAMSPIAFYDGFIGPGTGAYMAIVANRVLDLNYLKATAIAKPLNLMTNIGSLIIFIFAGKVVWVIAIPMAIASSLGAYVGSKSAIKKGSTFIRKILVTMLLVMLFVNLVKLFF